MPWAHIPDTIPRFRAPKIKGLQATTDNLVLFISPMVRLHSDIAPIAQPVQIFVDPEPFFFYHLLAFALHFWWDFFHRLVLYLTLSLFHLTLNYKIFVQAISFIKKRL